MTLANLLREGSFSVPRHQRYYDWDVEHVETLLQDLAEAATENSPCHFLGSIMLINHGSTKHWEINDGQQRIITFSLICAFLCKFFAENGQTAEERDALRVLYDLPEAHGKKLLQDGDSEKPRITPPRHNKANYNNLVRGHDVGNNGKMALAWKKIVSFFEESAHQNLAWRQSVLLFMLNNVVVVRLVVDKSLDSNAIFETLNYRGKHVGQMDLIKNHFLKSFNSDSTTARADTISDSFEEIYTGFNGNVKTVSKYVRCHMQAEGGFINEKRFLKETKNRFDGATDAARNEIVSLVARLSKKERIQAFKTFLHKSANRGFLDQLTTDARKAGNKRKIHDHLLDMYDYKVTRPVVFALFLLYLGAPASKKNAVAKFVYQCTKLLASFVQRTAHVGDFRPSAYDEGFAGLAKDISDGNCKNAAAFLSALRPCDNAGIITDKIYIEKVGANFSMRSDSKFAYIVRRIAEHQQTGLKIADDGNQTTIEHVLPKSPLHHSKSGWSSFPPEDLVRFSRTLGNLTVLARGEDRSSERDNESFAAKKKFYAKSSIVLSKDLCQHADWTPKVVKIRQRWMAKEAANIWNFR
ncbi:MAG: DUF262 domain-containing HNH endonuclease family protein [Alphaproteobacteria bacterium]|nr:DUF262 domain-containing HNH endonuclease family protein [Alphaproteobacteria bacterium]